MKNQIQFAPMSGRRHNGKWLNLNRDFGKIDTPEIRAVFCRVEVRCAASYATRYSTDGMNSRCYAVRQWFCGCRQRTILAEKQNETRPGGVSDRLWLPAGSLLHSHADLTRRLGTTRTCPTAPLIRHPTPISARSLRTFRVSFSETVQQCSAAMVSVWYHDCAFQKADTCSHCRRSGRLCW
jgi:hypothetical protein